MAASRWVWAVEFQTYSFADARLRMLVQSAWAMSYDYADGCLPGLIAPDAQVEFVFQFGSPCATASASSRAARSSPQAMIYAQRRGALRLSSTGGNAIVAFRAAPAVAAAILKTSLASCWDEPVALSDLIGAEAVFLAEMLNEADAPMRAAIIENWLHMRLADWASDDEEAKALQDWLMLYSDGGMTDIAERFGFSVRTLRRRCAASGLSPKQIANSGRILRACLLLREGDLSLAEIAGGTGFGDQSAFTNAFHAQTGVTPRQFRSEPLVFCERPATWDAQNLAAFCKTAGGRGAIPDDEDFGEE